MKNLLRVVFATVLLAGFAGFTSAQDSIESITNKFEKQKAEAIEAYLEKNPDAEDASRGYQALIVAYLTMDETKKLPDVIEKAYEKTDKRDVQTVLQQMVMPMMRACSENGEKDRAKKFLAKAKEDILGQPEIQQNPQAVAQINGIFGQMEGQLNQPGPGDEMKIAFTSTAEKEFDLADLKGKVVLVDFWATWCGPCIQEMPNVINAYQEYHDKGFEVVGISLDQDRAKLDAFVDQNKMPWPQYFDGKGWQNEIAGQFGINSIPATFLIGKDGKIAATNLRGPDLERAIKEELAKGDGAE